jgi:hypothetical protein
MSMQGAGRADEGPDPNFHWPLPDLAVGGRVLLEVAEALARRWGVRRVVDLRAEEQDDVELFRGHGVEVLHLPTPDMRPVEPALLWRGVRWVREGLGRGERVLVHCEYGIGRSVLLTACVLVSLGDAPCAALARIKGARAVACPAPDQLHALLDWAADWHRQANTPCPAATWDDLARIAYRDLQGGTWEDGG